MEVLDCIRSRRSVRNFSCGRPLTDEELDVILQAGAMAPSAKGLRPWEFVAVLNRDLLAALSELSPYAGHVRSAGAAIVVCAGTGEGGRPISDFWQQDCAAAIENMLLQAEAISLGGCWCGLYPRSERVEACRRLLGIDSLPMSILALGRPAKALPPRSVPVQAKIRILR